MKNFIIAALFTYLCMSSLYLATINERLDAQYESLMLTDAKASKTFAKVSMLESDDK